MSSYQELVSVLKEILTNRFYPKPEFIKGLLGDGLGNVVVPGRPDFNYVRFNRSANETFEVFNKEVSQPVDGTPVLIGVLPWQPGLVQVVGIDWESYIQTSWGNNYASIQAHAPTHEWPDFIPGSDYMRVFARAIYPLQGYGGGTGSMSFTAYPYQYDYTGTNSYWPGTPAVSLGPTRPPTGTMRYMGVYLNPATNQLGVVTGASVTFVADGEPPYPPWPLNVYPVAYARVYGGQAFFVERDIKDARRLWNTTLIYTGTSGGGGGAPSGPAGGDLTGTYPDPRVVSLNTIPILGAPANNQFLMFTGSAWRPSTLTIPGSWPFDNVRTVSQTDPHANHATIAAAITAASAGDVILLDAETFTVTADIAVSKAVTIMGHPGGSIITSSTANVNILNITVAARIVNLTITHTATTGTNVGIKVDAANAIIENCTITLSGAASINYGVFHNSGNGLRVNNCFVTVSGASVSNYGYTNQLNDATAEIYGGKWSGSTFDIHGSRAGSTLLIVKPVLVGSLISYSGTLSGDYKSAAGDIKQVKTTNDIFLGGDEAGVKKREIDIFQTSITDHFDGSALDAAWTWAAYTGFVTPGGIDLTHPSLLSIYLTGAQSATSKAFAYYSTYGSTILARCQCLSDVRAGLRMDDGTDDNYVETWLEYQSGLTKLRSRRSSATVVTGPTDIWATAAPIQFVTLRIATNTTSSYLVSYTINGSTLIFVANLTPTAITYTRSGIFYEQILNTVAAARAGVFDWYKQ